VFVLASKLPDYDHAVHNGIAGCFYLLYGSDHAVKIIFDAVSHSTVRFIQMADGHAVADITKDNAGKLQLIVLHIGGGIHTQHHVAVYGASDNDNGIDNTAVPHKQLILIDHQKTCHRQYISKCDR